MTRELIDRYMGETGINDRVLAHQHVSARTPEVMRVWNKMQMEDGYVKSLVHDISKNKANLQLSTSLDHFSESTEPHEGKYNSYIDNRSSNAELTEEEVNKYITELKGSLGNKYDTLVERNYDQKAGIKGGINAINRGLQNKVDTLEEDRIGQDSVSRIGGVLNFISGGRIDSVLGGPSKHESILNQNTNSASETYKDLEGVGPMVIPYTGSTIKK
jgi:hypothetical protein